MIIHEIFKFSKNPAIAEGFENNIKKNDISRLKYGLLKYYFIDIVMH